jgi:hypothetical protein
MFTVEDVIVDRAEALFASPVPTGHPVATADLNLTISETLRARGGVPGCAADMAAAYGENPAFAAERMRWALNVLRPAVAGPAGEAA